MKCITILRLHSACLWTNYILTYQLYHIFHNKQVTDIYEKRGDRWFILYIGYLSFIAVSVSDTSMIRHEYVQSSIKMIFITKIKITIHPKTHLLLSKPKKIGNTSHANTREKTVIPSLCFFRSIYLSIFYYFRNILFFYKWIPDVLYSMFLKKKLVSDTFDTHIIFVLIIDYIYV